ncbi:ATP-binding cassette domain-containing protein [Ornithobacterium rhinotracheale]|uniref:ABC transporter ATP-binding protein n=1 Tax=Ornithobacterium rhinotracheale TaxID=28251 RepID=UPI00129C219F|nr:ATP-binding cassette domain-containing protein [Ornithobacterium rhinotracheale]MRI62693.1 ATP-binding cassette domain-containing protein [Ornithobacterium rhinotracheale]MRJ08111.1 ATP-binding cassette domain-containing protein [Ornithobacterium rhinotracheale]MRJ10611.1 ATP-binding cassette domain-containing protein [Ornithobacterium rhinotracheale]UOH78382.1 ATP-binding cassette domain-containing protein [Ornithobacterium rhinotracheale]
MAIKVENITKTYGVQKALNNVSLHLEGNCILGLLGPNGAGKSTFMKCLVGLLLPTEGAVWIDGVGVKDHQVQIAKKIGYLPENNPLYYEMYVREYLTFVANIRNLSPQKVDDVVERVGLTPEQNKKIGQLSKGYKQRVGLAQAIIHEPEILILDEPTNGLDPNQILEIRELIKQEGQGKTVIVSTHIMQEVEALCDRVLVLNKGNKIADCSLPEFKENYQSLEEAFHQKTK